jgi:HAD superfamily hydrolase (TIGR01490 family)
MSATGLRSRARGHQSTCFGYTARHTPLSPLPVTLAIFDLDETLIAGDSDHLWGEYVVDAGLVDGEAYQRANDGFFADYKAGKLDIHAYLGLVYSVLTAHPLETLLAHRELFVERCIVPIVLPNAIDLVEKHRQQGHELLCITATSQFITEPIVRLFGIDDLIAPVPELADGRYTGKTVGVPSYAEGKVTRLHSWLAGRATTLADSYGYTDSINDVPLLKLVAHPHAVDPDKRLRAAALTAGWPVMSLR